jgi:hypothetical protein
VVKYLHEAGGEKLLMAAAKVSACSYCVLVGTHFALSHISRNVRICDVAGQLTLTADMRSYTRACFHEHTSMYSYTCAVIRDGPLCLEI